MATNKSALIRYKTINECLQNRFRKWTLEDLMEKVSDALYEFEGITTGISKRTIQADIQFMRSDKLGYNAPIVVTNRKFYCYEDPEYSITKSPIKEEDVHKMKEVVSLLKQFNGFQYFDEMSELIAKLENNIYKSSKKTPNYIQFEDNKQLKGIAHLSRLYKAILNKKPLYIEYKSFKSKQAIKEIYHPYLLKEYRNRWFLITRSNKGKLLVTLALDRIEAFYELEASAFKPYEGIDFERYYSECIGVTRSEKDRPQKIILKFNVKNAPYVKTKPIHHSQQILQENENGIVIRIDVIPNFELEREILGFGENVMVLAPKNLRKQIKNRINRTATMYQIEEM
ncbi:WYL domain-containing protein [Flavobacterium sp. CBA20B-1]|uniref:helix-turn-helix transcriptional regulator n=1 Tax=unclassified Flavobacterium TaxID=196869 RepID=UPI002224A69E|nr:MULTISPECIES: WYL domain-containing protein [unclassified Flavobacterium]WCM42802.1 WYL domain-containing protein [Flavobacterium sp. CBA20B-1]